MWPWAKTVQAVNTLATFWRTRQGFTPVERSKRPRLRWSMAGVKEEHLERLSELAASARRLAELMNHAGWKDMLEAKIYYQALYDHKTKNPDLSEQARFRSACEWAALEGFFIELSARVRRGQDAEKKLGQLVAQKR